MSYLIILLLAAIWPLANKADPPPNDVQRAANRRIRDEALRQLDDADFDDIDASSGSLADMCSGVTEHNGDLYDNQTDPDSAPLEMDCSKFP